MGPAPHLPQGYVSLVIALMAESLNRVSPKILNEFYSRKAKEAKPAEKKAEKEENLIDA